MPTETQTTVPETPPPPPPPPPLPPVPPVPPISPPCSTLYVEALNEDAARINHKFRYVWNFLANFHDGLLTTFNSFQFNMACKMDFQTYYRLIHQLMDDYKYLRMTGGDCIGTLGANTCSRPDSALVIQFFEMDIADKAAKVDDFYREAVMYTNPRAALGGGWKLCGEIYTDVPLPIGTIPPMTPPPTLAEMPAVQPPIPAPPIPAPKVETRPLPNNNTEVVTTDPVTNSKTIVIGVPGQPPTTSVVTPPQPVPAPNQPAPWEACIGAVEECNTKRNALITLMDQYWDAFAETQGWISNKTDTYDLNSDCWHYHDCWWNKGTEEQKAIQKLFDIKLNELPLADWDCPNDSSWKDKYDAYKKQLAFIESLVEQQGKLNMKFQRVGYAKDCPWVCTDAVSAYQPNMQPEPERSTCFLGIAATHNAYLEQINRINVINKDVADRIQQVFKTRNRRVKDSPCWKFFDAWMLALKTVSDAAWEGLRAIVKGADWTIDCTFDTGWEAKDKANAAKVAAMKIFIDGYRAMADSVINTGPDAFSDCDDKSLYVY